MSTILKAVKVSMIQPGTLSVMDKFKIIVDAGFDGISLFGPGQFSTKEVWADVRKALDEIGFNGWAMSEAQGGDVKRLTEVAQRMDKVLGIS